MSSQTGNSSGRARCRPPAAGAASPSRSDFERNGPVAKASAPRSRATARRSTNLDRLVAGDAGHRGFSVPIGRSERLDHRVTEALLVVEHVVGNAQRCGGPARISDILTGAAGALPAGGRAVVVELEGNAHHLIAFAGEQARNDGRIDASRHRDDDARVFGAPGKIERVQHWFHPIGVKGQRTGLCTLCRPGPQPGGSFCRWCRFVSTTEPDEATVFAPGSGRRRHL